MLADERVLLGERYELLDRIGAGGFSEVWRAHDHALDRPVAVKLLDARYARDAEALTRFRDEAHYAGCLTHAHIARVYDFAEPDQDQPAYLVMELVDGPSLADVLARGPVEPARCLDIISQAAAGLHEAHLHGLIHRDVKPGNILLGPEGVRVADFGIAHSADSPSLTRTGIVLGSAGYVAPERASGAAATPASDLYALGVVAYECLAGAPPFAGTCLEVALAHIHQPLPPLPAHVPDDVAAFVMTLASKDPALRPPSAAAVADHAARLRDRLTGASAVGVSAAGASASSPRCAVGAGATGAGAAGPLRFAPGGRGGEPAAVSRRPMPSSLRFVVAGTVAACLLAGLLLVSLLAPGTAPSAASARHNAGSVHVSDVVGHRAGARTMAVVRSRSLIGQPVALVVRRLRHLGLATRVIWEPATSSPPGVVVAVYPHGRRPAGSLVTVVGARERKPAHRARAHLASTCPAAASGPDKGHDGKVPAGPASKGHCKAGQKKKRGPSAPSPGGGGSGDGSGHGSVDGGSQGEG